MSDASERWLPAAGWEGLYEVSDLGHVRGIRRPWCTGKILKPRPTRRGYLRVCLYRVPRQPTDVYIHRLVMETFIGPCPPGQQVRHGPTGKHDNRLVNLCYGTPVDDCEDKTRDHAGNAKLNRAMAAEIRDRVAAGETQVAVARDFGVAQSAVGKIVHGERWRIA